MKTIFISSTFRDMQAERDVLHQQVFPVLRERLSAYGEDIEELDLRWGVDTSRMSEEESGRHVIESCIDSIDRCRPYMVVLLGERYGWIPGQNLMQQIHDSRISSRYQDEMSVTQLEILYGALEKENFDRCIFAFREEAFYETIPVEKRGIYLSESPFHKEKQNALKQRIQKEARARKMCYQPCWDEEKGQVGELSDFAQEMTEQIWGMLKEELGEAGARDPEERILQDVELTARRYLKTYVPREKEHGICASATNGRTGKWITGEAGSGKSALLASVWEICREMPEVHVFLYYCGNEGCGRVDTFLDVLYRWLVTHMNTEFVHYWDGLARREKFLQIRRILEAPRCCDLLFLIDAADQMEEDFFEILSMLGKSIFKDVVEQYAYGMIVTSLPEYFEQHAAALSSCFSQGKVEPFAQEEVTAFCQMHAQSRGKRLDSRVLQAIREKRGSKNPYYLSLVLQSLFQMDEHDFARADRMAPGMEGLSLYMTQKVKDMPEETDALVLVLLKETADKLNLYLGTMAENMADPLRLLQWMALSDEGLKLGDLEELAAEENCILPSLLMERMFCYLYDTFRQETDGRWEFRHRLTKENLLKGLEEGQIRKMYGMLSRYISRKKGDGWGLSYAVRSGDPVQLRQELKAAIKKGEVCQKQKISFCRLLLQHPGWAGEFCQTGDEEHNLLAGVVYDIALADRDKVLRQPVEWETLGKVLQENAGSLSLENCFGAVAVQWILLGWHQDIDKFQARSRELFDLYFQLPANFMNKWSDMLFEAICHIASRKNCAKLWGNLPVWGMAAKAALPLQWETSGMERVLYYPERQQKMAQREYGSEELIQLYQELEDLQKDAVCRSYEDLSGPEQMVYGTLKRQQVNVIDTMVNRKYYKTAMEKLPRLSVWYDKRWSYLPVLEEANSYLHLLGLRAQCVKPGYAEKYLRTQVKYRQSLIRSYPLEMLEEYLAAEHVALADHLALMEEKERADQNFSDSRERYRESQKYYRMAIEEFQSLWERQKASANGMYDLKWLEYLRYKRVRLRLEHDMWNWIDEKYSADGMTPKQYCQEMEADLEFLLWVEERLHGEEGREKLLGLQRWNLEYQMAYYDLRQQKAEALAACEKLFVCETEYLQTASVSRSWSGLRHFLQIAEICQRWKEGTLARKALTEAELLDHEGMKEWLLEKGRIEEWKRRYMRYLLTQARQNLEDQKAHQGIRLCEQAAAIEQQLGEDPENTDIEETVRGLGIRYRYLLGRLYAECQLQEKAAAVWKELTAERLRIGWMRSAETQLKLEAELYEGIGNLALLTKDMNWMKVAVAAYKDIMEDHTAEQDSRERVLLLEQVKNWAASWEDSFGDAPMPEAMTWILQISSAQRDKTERSRLLARKQKLFLSVQKYEANSATEDPAYKESLYELMDVLNDIWKTYHYGVLPMALPSDYSLETDTDTLLAKKGVLVKERIDALRRCCRYHWNNARIQDVIYLEQQVLTQLRYYRELVGEYIPFEELQNEYMSYTADRDKLPPFHEHSETEWLYLVNEYEALGQWEYARTKDVRYLAFILEEAERYRNFLRGRIEAGGKRTEWNKEVLQDCYGMDRKVYLQMARQNISSDQWLEAYLDTVRKQIAVNCKAKEKMYRELVEEMYWIQGQLPGQADMVQAVLDLVTDLQENRDVRLQYYMMKAARVLPHDVDFAEMGRYVQEHMIKGSETRK